jgi:hypothetical protein
MICELTSQPSSGAVKVWMAQGETRVVVQVPGMGFVPSLHQPVETICSGARQSNHTAGCLLILWYAFTLAQAAKWVA